MTDDTAAASDAISCVVIAFNEQHTIAATIESILSQEGPGFAEVIVVDDGSADPTAEIVRDCALRDPRVRLESLPTNQGRGAARAHGIERAASPFIAMVDADILLPPTWLATCQAAILDHDAVGGVPVPDGDATFLARHFALTPRVRAAAAQVTGSNGLYRQRALRTTGVDPSLREGEDVALNEDLDAAGFRLRTLHDLVVRHNEFRTFPQTARWLYQSGMGASRQLRRYKRIRTPDLAFFGMLTTLVAGTLPKRTTPGGVHRALPLAYLLGVGFAHMSSRFELGGVKATTVSTATACNALLMASYFSGRLVGLARPA